MSDDGAVRRAIAEALTPRWEPTGDGTTARQVPPEPLRRLCCAECRRRVGGLHATSEGLLLVGRQRGSPQMRVDVHTGERRRTRAHSGLLAHLLSEPVIALAAWQVYCARCDVWRPLPSTDVLRDQARLRGPLYI